MTYWTREERLAKLVASFMWHIDKRDFKEPRTNLAEGETITVTFDRLKLIQMANSALDVADDSEPLRNMVKSIASSEVYRNSGR